MVTNSGDVLGAGHAIAPRVVRRSTFFFWMSLVVLAIVLAGFGRTLFLRAFYPVPALPAYVFAHGVVMAAWCGERNAPARNVFHGGSGDGDQLC
jgi:hypothetical protein